MEERASDALPLLRGLKKRTEQMGETSPAAGGGAEPLAGWAGEMSPTLRGVLSPTASGQLPRVLTVWSMVGLIFFEVSGGPYGIEPVVRMAGHPWLALVCLSLTPLVWSAPIAVMTAEMVSAYPHVGGKIFFVQELFGGYVGWLNGVFNGVSNVFDVACLVPMALGYVEVLWAGDWWVSQGFCVAVVLAACALNVLGVELVGKASLVFTLCVCLPFVPLMGLGLMRVPALPSERFLTRPVSWMKFLSCLLWNMSGYDDAGATAAEVEDPEAVYPQSLGISMVLISSLYVGAILAGLTVSPDTSEWKDGHLLQVGWRLGGSPLWGSLLVGGALSCFGQLNALLCASVREVVCLAEAELPAPKCLATLHPKFQTPYVATLLFGALLLPLVHMEFTDLLAASMLFDVFSFVLQFLAWLKHRWQCRGREPSAGAFRSRLNFCGVLLASSGPLLLCCAVLVISLLEDGRAAVIGFVVTWAVATLIYVVNGFLPS